MKNPSRMLGILIIMVGLIAGAIAEVNAQVPEGTMVQFTRISDNNTALLLEWEYNLDTIDTKTIEEFIYGGYGDYEIIIVVVTKDNRYEIYPQFPKAYLTAHEDGTYDYSSETATLSEAIEYVCK